MKKLETDKIVMGVKLVDGKKLSRVVYENLQGERKVYYDMVIDDVRFDRIIVKLDTDEYKTFVFARILDIDE